MIIGKKNVLLVILFSFLFLNIANAQNEEVGSASTLSDGEMITIINAVNQNEITISEMMQKRKISLPVMEYVQMLHREHTNNMSIANELLAQLNIPVSGNTMSEEILKHGADELATLSAKNDDDVEIPYLDAMISGHTKVVDMIDGWLTAGVSNEQVKNYLMDTRSHVQMHLEEARKLR